MSKACRGRNGREEACCDTALKMLEQYAEVWFLSIWSTSEWMSEGNEVVMLGMVGAVLSRF